MINVLIIVLRAIVAVSGACFLTETDHCARLRQSPSPHAPRTGHHRHVFRALPQDLRAPATAGIIVIFVAVIARIPLGGALTLKMMDIIFVKPEETKQTV